MQAFGRHADYEGERYFSDIWEFRFDKLPEVGMLIANAAQNQDKLNLDAKVAVAERFTAHLDTATEVALYSGAYETGRARDFLAAVDHDHIPTDQDIDAFIAGMGAAHIEAVGGAAIAAELI